MAKTQRKVRVVQALRKEVIRGILIGQYSRRLWPVLWIPPCLLVILGVVLSTLTEASWGAPIGLALAGVYLLGGLAVAWNQASKVTKKVLAAPEPVDLDKIIEESCAKSK